MKIGIMLGSFDPIHVGHVSVMTQVLNEGLVDKLLIVPAVQNPFKVIPPAPFDVRCQMIQAEIEKLNAFYPDKIMLSRIEETIEAPNYSFKTLTKIKEDFNDDELFLVCGTDIIEEIDKWKNFKTDILPHFKYIEIGRNVGFVEDGKFDVPVDGGNISVTRTPNVLHMISSSKIRTMCEDGKCPLPLVSDSILCIIKEKKLYQK